MTDWYCKIAGKLYGPYDHAKLRQMAAENRLMPNDLLREGEDGDWFPADEIENLFPASRRKQRDDDDDDDWERRQRKRDRKLVNYYSAFMRSLTDFGNWTQYIGWTAVFTGLLWGVTAGIVMAREGGFNIAVLFMWLLLGAITLLAFCFFDALLFGIPCMLMGVRLDPRRHNVLDLFGYAYVLGLAVVLFRMLTACLSTMIADFLMLLIPFVHGTVFGYLLPNYWHLPTAKALGLTSIRFAYQMLFVAGYLIVRYYTE